MTKTYHFTCKNCRHEFLHNNEPTTNCPKCETENQTDGKLAKKN